MKLNWHGVVGLLAICAMIGIAFFNGGWYIVFGAVVIIAYGALVIIVSPTASVQPPSIGPPRRSLPSATESDRHVDHRYATTRAAADIWLIALHAGFLLAIVTLLLDIPYKPFINIPLIPLVLLISYTLVGLNLIPAENGPEWRSNMSFSLAPALLFVGIAFARSWTPFLYVILGVIVYCVALLMRLEAFPTLKTYGPDRSNYNLPWPLFTHSWSEDSVHLTGLAPVRIYLVMILLAVGLLINVASFDAPGSWPADLFHNTVWLCIFASAIIIGYALPSLLIKKPTI